MPTAVDTTCAKLTALHREDKYHIQVGTTLKNMAKSAIRNKLGWKFGLDKRQRDCIAKKANTYFDAFTPKKPKLDRIPTELHIWMVGLFGSTRNMIQNTNLERAKLKADMEALAENLPGIAWAKSVRGFGITSYAHLIAETGNLSRFRNRDCVVKRMGISPPNTYGMTTKAGKTVNAIPRMRRSILWVIGDNLIKSGNKTYRAIYDEQKKRRTALRAAEFKLPAGKRKGLKGHIHKQAHRAMERRFVRDMYAAWKKDA